VSKPIVLGLIAISAVALWACSPAPNDAPTPPATPAPAAAPAPAVQANPKCPDFKITFEIGKPGANAVTLTLTPALPEGVRQVFWHTTAGQLSGEGTTVVVSDLPPGILFTVVAEIDGLDASCDRHDAFHSASVQMP